MVIDVYVVSNVHKSFDFHISDYVIDSELCIQQKGYQLGSHVALGSNKAVH